MKYILRELSLNIAQLSTCLKALDEIYKFYTRFTHFCTFWIRLKNNEKRFWQASAGRSTRPRRRNHKTAAMQHLWNPMQHRSAFKNSFRLNFVRHFRIFALICSIHYVLFFRNMVQNSPAFSILMFFQRFSNLYRKEQNLLDSQVSWAFATNIFEIFITWFS